jgi:hypothetical protein
MFYSEDSKVEYIYGGATGRGFYFNSANGNDFSNIYVFGHTYTSSSGCLTLQSCSNNYFKDIYLYNCGGSGVWSYISSDNYYENVNIDDAGTDGVNFSNSRNEHFYNLNIDTAGDDGVQLDYYSFGIYINDYTFSSITDDDFLVQGRSSSPLAEVNTLFVTDTSWTGSLGGKHKTSKEGTIVRTGSSLKITPDTTFGHEYGWSNTRVGVYQAGSGTGDITLSVYMRDDASYNGTVRLFADVNGQRPEVPTEKTMTTSFVQQTLVVDDSYFDAGDWLTLYVQVSGTAGNVYVDDFAGVQ